MKMSTRLALVSFAVVGVLPVVADAHFKLVAPASWIIENDRGDPLRGKEFREEEFPELRKVRSAGS